MERMRNRKAMTTKKKIKNLPQRYKVNRFPFSQSKDPNLATLLTRLLFITLSWCKSNTIRVTRDLKRYGLHATLKMFEMILCLNSGFSIHGLQLWFADRDPGLSESAAASGLREAEAKGRTRSQLEREQSKDQCHRRIFF